MTASAHVHGTRYVEIGFWTTGTRENTTTRHIILRNEALSLFHVLGDVLGLSGAADYRAQTILRKIINESGPLTLLHTHFTEDEAAYIDSLDNL